MLGALADGAGARAVKAVDADMYVVASASDSVLDDIFMVLLG